MRLSRTVIYAIQATVQLGAAEGGEAVPSRQLAEAGQMPDRFLLQILRNLVAHGLLFSTRGVVGGYKLARSLDQISLLDIIEAIEGPVSFDTSQVKQHQILLEEALSEVTANVRRDLAAFKMSRLLGRTRRGS